MTGEVSTHIDTNLQNPAAGAGADLVLNSDAASAVNNPVIAEYKPSVGWKATFSPFNVIAKGADWWNGNTWNPLGASEARIEADKAFEEAKEALLADELVSKLKDSSELQKEHQALLDKLNQGNSADASADKTTWETIKDEAAAFTAKVDAETAPSWAGTLAKLATASVVLGGTTFLVHKNKDAIEYGLQKSFDATRKRAVSLRDAAAAKWEELTTVDPVPDNMNLGM